uniref:Uncharacterized protein n=1 Tax=Rhabditophanes sp. KR3021 TaxID=114890 RepID=A0AC35TTB2_9BILA
MSVSANRFANGEITINSYLIDNNTADAIYQTIRNFIVEDSASGDSFVIQIVVKPTGNEESSHSNDSKINEIQTENELEITQENYDTDGSYMETTINGYVSEYSRKPPILSKSPMPSWRKLLSRDNRNRIFKIPTPLVVVKEMAQNYKEFSTKLVGIRKTKPAPLFSTPKK